MRVVARWPTRRAFVLDLVIALLLLAVSGGTSFLDVPADAHWQLYLRLVTATLVAAAALGRRRRQLPLLVTALLDQLTHGDVAAGMPFAAYAITRYGPRARSRLVFLAVGLAVNLAPWQFTSLTETLNNVVIVGFLVVLPAVLGAWVRTRAELLAALRERAERAEREQQALAREAVLEERVRIAREMHDVVGHRVSLMVLQAGAIDMAAADVERVRQLAGQLQDAGRRSLQELRQLIGLVLQAADEDAPLAPQPALTDLDELVAGARRAGLEVTLEQRGADREVEPTVGRTAYRVVQEALTNAGKHAPGGPVAVTLDVRAAELTVRVLNGRPTRPVTPMPSGGLGLIGLRERVRTVGGTFRAEPRLDGGFGVEAVLPG
jgi:signal transduction histidine kinase